MTFELSHLATSSPRHRPHPAERSLAFLRWSACALGLLLGTTAYAQSVGQRTLEAAQSLLSQVKPGDTSYEHGKGSVHWLNEPGSDKAESHTDCSGLINALLHKSYGVDAHEFQAWLGKSRPLAKTYHEAISAGRGFERIQKVSDIRPGDLIAIRYPDGSANSGHIMVVAEAAQAHSGSKPFVSGTTQWAVRIIDSSQSGHGASDSRYVQRSVFRSGLGEGVLRLYATGDGRVAGYSWSLYPNSAYYAPEERELVVGRLTHAPSAKHG